MVTSVPGVLFEPEGGFDPEDELTVSVTELLVTLPPELLTTTSKVLPLSALVVAGVV